MAENISNLENEKDFNEIAKPSAELIESFHHMLKDIGEDPLRDGLLDTPKRAAAAFKFLNHGYKMSLDKVVNNALFDSEIEDMVLVKNDTPEVLTRSLVKDPAKIELMMAG